MEFTYTITNGTKTTIESIQITTTVFDEQGVVLGTINNQFCGGNFTGIKKGEAYKKKTNLSKADRQENAFFDYLYVTDLDKLTLEHEVKAVIFEE